MSFTYDLSTDVGLVRLRIADTSESAYAFSDEEVTALVSAGGSVNGGVVLALRSLLVDAARRAKSFSLPGVSYNDTARVAGIKEALRMYGDLPSISVISPSNLPMDSGYVEQPVIVVS